MPAIFYDLETSDRLTIGQILNYCFILVDDSLEIRSELHGGIAIGRLQWPSPSAIVANRIDVRRHQEAGYPSERESVVRIARFIAEAIDTSGSEKLPLIGFNSSRFDLGYLRTTLYRNGINPYFSNRLCYRDLLHAARKLACTDPTFPRTARDPAERDRISLALEHLTRQLGLLQGAQEHESRADVILTIELARTMRERFHLDPLSYVGYEAARIHPRAGQPEVFYACEPEYSLTGAASDLIVPVTLLDATASASLWVDLIALEQGAERRSVRWVSANKDQFMIAEEGRAKERWGGERARLEALAARAQSDFKGLTTKNFFTRSTCDIEQDIYRLDFDDLDSLAAAVWRGDDRRVSASSHRDLRVVYQRYKLANYQWESGDDERVRDLLRQYALHRYGGRMNISKGEPLAAYEPGADVRRFHPNYREIIEELEKLAAASPEHRELLDSLRVFYHESDLWRVAGEDLAAIEARRIESCGEPIPTTGTQLVAQPLSS